MVDDYDFYTDNSEVRITRTQVLFHDSVYSLADISSVKTISIPAKRDRAIFTSSAGFGIFLIGTIGEIYELVIFGLIISLLGIFWAWIIREEYFVILSSVFGEIFALKSKNKIYINTVVQAINKALSSQR